MKLSHLYEPDILTNHNHFNIVFCIKAVTEVIQPFFNGPDAVGINVILFKITAYFILFPAFGKKFQQFQVVIGKVKRNMAQGIHNILRNGSFPIIHFADGVFQVFSVIPCFAYIPVDLIPFIQVINNFSPVLYGENNHL